jgi:hypothetical protein
MVSSCLSSPCTARRPSATSPCPSAHIAHGFARPLLPQPTQFPRRRWSGERRLTPLATPASLATSMDPRIFPPSDDRSPPTRAIARRTDLTSRGRCRIMHLCQRVGGELAVDFLWCLKDPVVPPTAVGVRPSRSAGLGRRRAHRRQSRAGRTLRSPAHPRAAISPAMCCCSTPAGGDNKPVPLDTCKIVSGG